MDYSADINTFKNRLKATAHSNRHEWPTVVYLRKYALSVGSDVNVYYRSSHVYMEPFRHRITDVFPVLFDSFLSNVEKLAVSNCRAIVSIAKKYFAAIVTSL